MNEDAFTTYSLIFKLLPSHISHTCTQPNGICIRHTRVAYGIRTRTNYPIALWRIELEDFSYSDTQTAINNKLHMYVAFSHIIPKDISLSSHLSSIKSV